MAIVSVGSIEQGYYVERVPSHGITVRVPIRDYAPTPEIGAMCDRLDGVGNPAEIGWGFFKKAVKWTKKAVGKSIDAAKDVAKSRVVKKLYSSVREAAPTPWKEYLQAAETGVKFTKAITKGSKKAKRAAPVVKALAAGKISRKKAERLARKAGVKPSTVKRAAAFERMKNHPKVRHDPKVKQALAAAHEIEKAGQKGAGYERIVRAPESGRKYIVNVSLARKRAA